MVTSQRAIGLLICSSRSMARLVGRSRSGGRDRQKGRASLSRSVPSAIFAYYTGPDADKVKHKLDLFLPKGKSDFPGRDVRPRRRLGFWRQGFFRRP